MHELRDLGVLPTAMIDISDGLASELLHICRQSGTGAVIFDEGTISSCENLEATGNLRDFDWDFGKAWNSAAMVARRKKAKNGCFCTHESNSYYPSLPFNPKHLIQIKKLEKQMKKASKELGRRSDGISGTSAFRHLRCYGLYRRSIPC